MKPDQGGGDGGKDLVDFGGTGKDPAEEGARRKYSWLERLMICQECSHVAPDLERHRQHFKEARHINWLRAQAYREPKKRALWLRIWFKTVEEVEEANPWALAFDETEEFLAV